MKLSNILLASFCTLFIIYLFGVAAEVRFKGVKNVGYEEQSNQYNECTLNPKTTIPLPSFKILKINNISDLGTISFSNQKQNSFSVYTPKDSVKPQLNYHTSGDTLFLETLDNKGICKAFRIDLTEHPHTLIVDSMVIHLTTTSTNLKKLQLKGSSTQFHLLDDDKSIDSLKLDLANQSILTSNARLSIDNLEGAIKEFSRIHLYNAKVESANVQIGVDSQINIMGRFYTNPDPNVKLIYQQSTSMEK